jgi:hypothetical protein
MELKIIVPTHIWEFEPIQRMWFTNLEDSILLFNCLDEIDYIKDGKGFGDIDIELIHEQGEAPSGRNVRQKYTNIYADKDVWVHWLDNDNLIQVSVIEKLMEITSMPKIIMFGQIWHTNGIKRLNAHPENCLPARCDIAQLFVHGSFLKDMVWSADYENDGQFIAELHKRYPNDFVFVNDVNVWYNALKPYSTLYNGQIITIA